MRSQINSPFCRKAWIAASIFCASAVPLWAQAERRWIDPPVHIIPPSPSPPADPTPEPKAARDPAPMPTNTPPPVGSAEPPRVAVQPAVAQPERRASPVPPPVPPGPSQSTPGEINRPKNDGGAGEIIRSRLPTPPEVTLGLQAEQLTFDYLDFWSAPNAVTLEQMPGFYGREVMFHGQHMSVQALMDDKRRFARRWPDRRYKPRPESMQIACDPHAKICNVRTVVDFVAMSRERAKRSQGAITLALDIRFSGGRAIIITENSRLITRGAGDADDE